MKAIIIKHWSGGLSFPWFSPSAPFSLIFLLSDDIFFAIFTDFFHLFGCTDPRGLTSVFCNWPIARATLAAFFAPSFLKSIFYVFCCFLTASLSFFVALLCAFLPHFCIFFVKKYSYPRALKGRVFGPFPLFCRFFSVLLSLTGGFFFLFFWPFCELWTTLRNALLPTSILSWARGGHLRQFFPFVFNWF